VIGLHLNSIVCSIDKMTNDCRNWCGSRTTADQPQVFQTVYVDKACKYRQSCLNISFVGNDATALNSYLLFSFWNDIHMATEIFTMSMHYYNIHNSVPNKVKFVRKFKHNNGISIYAYV
jgi:hypothetical protein